MGIGDSQCEAGQGGVGQGYRMVQLPNVQLPNCPMFHDRSTQAEAGRAAGRLSHFKNFPWRLNHRTQAVWAKTGHAHASMNDGERKRSVEPGRASRC